MEVLFDFCNNSNTPLGLERPVFSSHNDHSFSPYSQTRVCTHASLAHWEEAGYAEESIL